MHFLLINFFGGGFAHLTTLYRMQITKTAGSTLMNFDISNCPSLTDQSCASISRYCMALEVLGMRNLKAITGEGLSQFFLDKKRADKFQKILLSGSKNVIISW